MHLLLYRSCIHEYVIALLKLRFLIIFGCGIMSLCDHVVFLTGPKILTYVTKVIVQCLQLLSVLMRMELQSHILMQVLDWRYK